uniref:Dehydrogenase/reductase SDR family member 4-like n=1 Tax=Saccoglossus kowalevskii TaxID=10224 RepID=A0ABM0MPA7_SACKO|nr:PREDICTED: dehydrogenase/reductase SDR family member 4-like [Saccoglossus kowalevskii]
MSSFSNKFHGKVAVVTASTEGIGFAIAKRLAEDGASVMISSRKQENVDTALAKLKSENLTKVAGVVCHVGKEDHRNKMIQETLRRFGGIDILVSNAACSPMFGPVLEIFDINVKATFLLIKEIVPHIEKRGGGNIVMISSLSGYTPFQMIGAYGVSKTALLGLTKALVPECSEKNIRVNCIAPGLIQTRFSEMTWKNPSIRKNVEALIPMSRIGQPSECAGVVSFLCSDDASFISGETIIMSGGIAPRL